MTPSKPHRFLLPWILLWMLAGDSSASTKRPSLPRVWGRRGNSTGVAHGGSGEVPGPRSESPPTGRNRTRERPSKSTKASSKRGAGEEPAEAGDPTGTNQPNTEASPEPKPKPKPRGRGPFGFFKPLPEEAEGESSSPTNSTTSEVPGQPEPPATEPPAPGDTGTNATLSTAHNATLANNNGTAPGIPPTRVYYMGGSALAVPPGATGAPLPPGGMPGIYRGGPAVIPPASNNPRAVAQTNPALLLTAVMASAVGAITRVWLIVWVARRLAQEDEMITPEQHFVWECLNDRYSKDATVLTSVMSTPPKGFSQRKWGEYVKKSQKAALAAKDKEQQAAAAAAAAAAKEEEEEEEAASGLEDGIASDSSPSSARRKLKTKRGPQGPVVPNKSVIVVDITPGNQLDIKYLTDVVNFLVTAHARSQFGFEPEIVLLVKSPGGAVTHYGLAAAQVGRLQQVGLNVTVCVDSIAASGGYMIAAQANTLIAAPFAYIGSIGVMSESLNFNELLTEYGIKPLVLKAGDSKNRLSALGPVSDEDIQNETDRMEKIHELFIELCLSRRPSLDPSICDGTVVVGSEGLEFGMVDRVLTSEEYIWELLREGAHVLKLHKALLRPSTHIFFARALDVLPHLNFRAKLMKWQNNVNFQKMAAWAIQGAAVADMLRRNLFTSS